MPSAEAAPELKKAVLYGARDLRLEPLDLNPAGLQPDEVYVETEVTALSTGTDLGNYLGDSTYVPGAPPYPIQVGYSNTGVVRRVGTEVSRLAAGQRVFSLKPHQSAYIASQNELLVPAPPGVLPEQASLAYLTQLGLAALRQARYEAGESVVVVGLGVIGLCTAALTRAMGARVVGIASATARMEVALRVGAHAAFLSGDPQLRSRLGAELPGGADIVVLTANTWDAYRLSVETARHGGRVSILGFPGRAKPTPDFNPLDPAWLYAKQLTLLGSGGSPRLECDPADVRFNTRRNLEYILELMAAGSLALEPVISHRLPASRMLEAYELAAGHSKDLVAAIFHWAPAAQTQP
jgi:threonine dehydrogenase-like Zn-dependent dehydrogenase